MKLITYTVIKMRIPNKKLGFAGALTLVSTALGCNSTVPQPVVDPTYQAISQYDQVKNDVDFQFRMAANKAAEDAKNENTRRLVDQREKDLQPLRDAVASRDNFLKNKAAFDKLCENPIFVSPNANASSIPSRNSLLVQNAQAQPQQPIDKSNSSTEFYALAKQRLDSEDVPLAYGGGLRHSKGNKYVGFEIDSMSNTVSDLNSNLTANKTGYNLVGGLCSEIGACALRAGLGYTFQATDIYGQNGISTIDDTRTDHFPYAEAGLRLGKKTFLEVKVRQGLGGDNRNASGVTVCIGGRK